MRVSATSGVRTRIISPRTGRNSNSASRAAKPRQSMIASKSRVSCISVSKRTIPPRLSKRSEERSQRRARIEMAFVGEKKAVTEPPGELRLKRGNLFLVDAQMPARASGEALDIARIAGARDDQRAGARDFGRRALPTSRARRRRVARPPPARSRLRNRARACRPRSTRRSPRQVSPCARRASSAGRAPAAWRPRIARRRQRR